MAVPPATEPVTLAEAKLHLRVDHSDEDALVSRLIVAARRWCEDFHGRAWIARTVRLKLERFPVAAITLPFPPIQSVTSIQYTRSDGTAVVIAPAAYRVLTGEPAQVLPVNGWPADSLAPGLPVVVEYQAGYGDATAVPEDAKAALLLILGSLYENRSDEGLDRLTRYRLELGAQALLRPNRRVYEGPEGP